MLFLGHIAISLLLADATESDRAAAVAGNLAPDIVSKTGGWVLRLMPSGRWLAHGLPFALLVIGLARLFLGERQWRGFALGYAGHLVADLWAGGKVPWLAPFVRPPRREERRRGRIRRRLLWLLPEPLGAWVIWRLLSAEKSEADWS